MQASKSLNPRSRQGRNSSGKFHVLNRMCKFWLTLSVRQLLSYKLNWHEHKWWIVVVKCWWTYQKRHPAGVWSRQCRAGCWCATPVREEYVRWSAWYTHEHSDGRLYAKHRHESITREPAHSPKDTRNLRTLRSATLTRTVDGPGLSTHAHIPPPSTSISRLGNHAHTYVHVHRDSRPVVLLLLLLFLYHVCNIYIRTWSHHHNSIYSYTSAMKKYGTPRLSTKYYSRASAVLSFYSTEKPQTLWSFAFSLILLIAGQTHNIS